MRLRILALLLPLLLARVCVAHPMGNFSINHYAGIRVEKKTVEVLYIIDRAEIPTYQEMQDAGIVPQVGDASLPKYLVRAEIPAADIEKEKEIHTYILRKEGKPEASIPKIIEGKINKLFYQQWVLLDQVLLRDNKQNVSGLIAAASAKLGGEVKVVRFVRYQLGS